MRKSDRLNILLGAILFLSASAHLAIGSVALSAGDWMALLTGTGPDDIRMIIRDIRIPRILAAALAGLALGAAGAAMQGLLRNPLAEPGTMGVSATAALFATAAVYFGWAQAASWLMPVAAVAGALVATAIISGSAVRQRSIGTMILIGVALSALAGAIMALFVNLAPNPFSLSDLINWTAGSVVNRDWTHIAIGAPAIAAGLMLLSASRRALSAMLFGEEVAASMGVDLSRMRLLLILGVGLATGGAVAIAGMIGFVGLIAPHIVRAAVGHDAGRTILPSALAAAIMLVLADAAIRLWPAGPDLHLGTVTALIGAPLFAIIAWRAGNLRHG